MKTLVLRNMLTSSNSCNVTDTGAFNNDGDGNLHVKRAKPYFGGQLTPLCPYVSTGLVALLSTK